MHLRRRNSDCWGILTFVVVIVAIIRIVVESGVDDFGKGLLRVPAIGLGSHTTAVCSPLIGVVEHIRSSDRSYEFTSEYTINGSSSVDLGAFRITGKDIGDIIIRILRIVI